MRKHIKKCVHIYMLRVFALFRILSLSSSPPHSRELKRLYMVSKILNYQKSDSGAKGKY